MSKKCFMNNLVVKTLVDKKKYWHQKSTRESKTLVMKTLCQIPKEKTQLRALFICYTHSNSTTLKGTCMWYYDVHFPSIDAYNGNEQQTFATIDSLG